MTKEKLIEAIMAECEKEGEPVTAEEAAEMAEMEIKAGNVKRYEQASATKTKTKREVKKDPNKIDIINFIFEAFDNVVIPSGKGDTCMRNMVIKNDQREITFNYNGAEYSLTLTKHRPPKTK